jgi:hypothetical protein
MYCLELLECDNDLDTDRDIDSVRAAWRIRSSSSSWPTSRVVSESSESNSIGE